MSPNCGTLTITDNFVADNVLVGSCANAFPLELLPGESQEIQIWVTNTNEEDAQATVEVRAGGTVIGTSSGAVGAKQNVEFMTEVDTAGLSEGEYTVSAEVVDVQQASFGQSGGVPRPGPPEWEGVVVPGVALASALTASFAMEDR